MLVTQKCQYALRAVLELATHPAQTPVKIAQIAEEQAIPFRFLEVILSQLKQGGFVESRRGTDGGYLLARKANSISVSDIVEFIDGPIWTVEDGTGGAERDVFDEVWHQATESLLQVLRNCTIQDLIARRETLSKQFEPNYQI